MANDLIVTGSGTNIPLANFRNVFHAQEVQRRLDKLPEKDHDNLRTVYERMIERGPERFQVKPSSIPEMESLYEQMPNFTEALDEVRRQLALALDCHDGIQMTPTLLLGPPGIGKTHFAKKLADLLGTGMNLVPMSSMTAGWLLSGSSSQWRGAKPGKVFETLVDGQYANPVIVVDEVDKAACDTQYDPLGAMYSLLEHDTAKQFVDEFAEVAIDASQVIWVLTANDERAIPKPIMNRMNVFEVIPPTRDQARTVARKLYTSIRESHGWGKRFNSEPSADLLDRLAEIGPREMRRSLLRGFGDARLEGSDTVTPHHLGKKDARRSSIGFTAS